MSQNYKILHSQVGPFPRGRVVSESELRDVGGTSERLLRLKAIEETAEPITTDPLEVGPENDGQMATMVAATAEPEIPVGSAHREVIPSGLRFPPRRPLEKK